MRSFPSTRASLFCSITYCTCASENYFEENSLFVSLICNNILSKITRYQIAEVAVTHFENCGNIPTVFRCPFRLKGKGKGEVVPVRAIKACRGSRCTASLINVGARWRWVISFKPRPIYPRLGVEDCVGSRAGPDLLEKREISCPRWYSNHWPSSPQLCHCNNYAIPTPRV
jgi:hypothetical protein